MSELTKVTNRVFDSTIVIVEKTNNHTIERGDAGEIIRMNSASNLTVTVPTNTNVPFPIGTQVVIVRQGLGEVTIASQDVSVVLRSDTDRKKIAKQYTSAALIKIGTNEWLLIGNLTA